MAIGHKNGSRYKCLVRLGKNPDDCWEWVGCVNKTTGYGKKQWHGKPWLAHRWVWTMLFGKIEEGMTINHKCSNRACVNPHHLEVVTQTENCRHGEGTKLTPEIVRRIRDNRPRWGERQKLANKYGVSPATISDIIYGRSWTNID